MNETKLGARAFRFGIFELDLQARELRRRGLKVKLQEKPFQVLEMLLSRPGEVVTRKELCEKLWPETFVGFDHSLNTVVNCLRRALGDLPANPRFLETKSRHGYRFIAPVEPIRWNAPQELRDSDAINSIAVLPFHNASGNPELEYLSDGISEALIHALSQVPETRVMARSTVFRYKGKHLDLQSVGQDLHVRALVIGTVKQQADELAISVELVDTANGWRLWGEQYARKLSEVASVQEEIAREVAHKLRLRFFAEVRERLSKQYTASFQAYQHYLRGRYHWNKMTPEEIAKGISYFKRAIEADPQFALPYAGLSDSYVLFAFFGISPSLEMMPKAEQAARKALALNEGLPEAHASLAGILKSYYWDWAEAEREYRRAIEGNVNDAIAHRWYANFLAALGRKEEAVKEMERARELDPLSLIINMELAWIFYMDRDNQQAIDQALETLDIEPQFPPAFHVLSLACGGMGKYKEAATAAQKAYKGSGGNPISLAAVGYVYAQAGRKAEAKKIFSDLKNRSKHSYIPPYIFATLCFSLHDIRQGLTWLEKACDERDTWLSWILVDPRLDIARSEPRFHQVLRRMNLPAGDQCVNPGQTPPWAI